MTGSSAAVQAACRTSARRPYRPAGRKAKYGRFSVLPRLDIYRNLRIKDSVKIDPCSGSGGMGFPGGMGKPDGDIPVGDWDGQMPDFGGRGQMPEWDPENAPAMEDRPDSDNLPAMGDRSPFGAETAQKSSVILVHVNGHIVSFDTDPELEDGTTLVGFRAILEALGAEVDWDEASGTVTAVKGDTTIVLTVGSDTAYVNGEAYTLLRAPAIIDGSTMVPVRFLSESLGMKVSWDGDGRLIAITSKA